jgi:hypothetical protein
VTAFDVDADGGLSNRRIFADRLGPDGICLDAEGAVWVSTGGSAVVRVAAGGEVRQRVELGENRTPFAIMLGGPDRRTLFILTAEWRPDDSITPCYDGSLPIKDHARKAAEIREPPPLDFGRERRCQTSEATTRSESRNHAEDQ